MAAADATPERPHSTDLRAESNVRTPPGNDQCIDSRPFVGRVHHHRSAVQGHRQRCALDVHG